MNLFSSWIPTLFLGLTALVQAQDIVDVAVSAGFSTLAAAVTAADLVGTLQSEGPFTVFAPTNDAFAALGPATINFLLKDEGIPTLTDVLLYHVVVGAAVASDDLKNKQKIDTALGETVKVTIKKDEFKINDSNVVAADVGADNGIIHVIDAVLIPPDFSLPDSLDPKDNIIETADDAGFNTLLAALDLVSLTEVLENEEALFTVFAPTDDAFAALPTDIFNFLLKDFGASTLTTILLYHVVQGQLFSTSLSDGQRARTVEGSRVRVSINDEGLFINDSKAIVTDVLATNGLIHVIDAVLLPPRLTLPQTILNTAAGVDDLSVLAELVGIAGLAEPLGDADNEFTVFAPVNSAWKKLPPIIFEFLFDESGVDLLSEILLYHVADSVTFFGDIEDGDKIKTLQGDKVKVDIPIETGVAILNDDISFVAVDVLTLNGVVHLIDGVLIPSKLDFPDIIPDDNIVETAIAGGFSTLVAAVDAAGLVDVLADEGGSFTVFAPTDEAFANLPSDFFNFLLTPQGIPTLTEILLYHVLPSVVVERELSDGARAKTALGPTVKITFKNDCFFVNDSEIIQTNIFASNGVIHVIDAVLNPPRLSIPADIVDTAVGAGFNTLAAAVTAADLIAPLKDLSVSYTVFAPTDDAFNLFPRPVLETLLTVDGIALLTEILLYHVVDTPVFFAELADGDKIKTLQGGKVKVSVDEGGNAFIDASKVLVTDVIALNGIIHVIDRVLIPKVKFPDIFPEDNIVETAVGAGFDTLVAAVGAAGLVGALENPDVYLTVFAPTDDAFAALPSDILSYLLTDRGLGDLTTILLYHVVGTQFTASDLSDGQSIATLEGSSVTVSIGAQILLDESVVIATDIFTSNGVIHVIDKVLLPSSLSLPGTLADEVPTTLAAALAAVGLVGALSDTGAEFTVFAPTNGAFKNLPLGVLPFLLSEEGSDLLEEILLYHVVDEIITSADLEAGDKIKTLLGQKVVVSFDSRGRLLINQSRVIEADNPALNGIFHIINAVLIPDVKFPKELTPKDNLVETAIDADFDILVDAVEAAGLVDALANPDAQLTVFAPTDEAFKALPEAVQDLISSEEGKDALTTVLLYHVLGSAVFSTDLSDGLTAETLEGSDVTVSINEDGIFINESKVIAVDILTTNGVIHVIDQVLEPPSISFGDDIVELAISNGQFTTLVTAVQIAGLVETLRSPGPFTVFAPTDDAFSALFDTIGPGATDFILGNPDVLGEILLYHVVAKAVLSTDLKDGKSLTTVAGTDVEIGVGDEITINSSVVIFPDVIATNGVIHVIDAVLIPPDFVVPGDIVETAIAAGSFTTLVAAVTAADLAGALQFSKGVKLTVFAPTDDAFGALPEGLVASLLEDENIEILTDILLYHIVGTQALSTDLSDGQTVTTLQGEEVTVTINCDGIFINKSKVVAPDILVTNGVIHAIDAVLLFPGLELP